MRIDFRVDASLLIGTGHVMRCLALANALRKLDMECRFICRQQNGNLLNHIKNCGYKTVALPKINDGLQSLTEPWFGVDWALDARDVQQALGFEAGDFLIIDHYGLDYRWEVFMRPYFNKIMVIDDLANRPHDCDLLLDQNLGRVNGDYLNLLKAGTNVLSGPKFALLRPEFSQWRSFSLARRARPQLKQVLIAMGGVDIENFTGQTLQIINGFELPADLKIVVVMGSCAPYLEDVKGQALCMSRPTLVLTGIENMAELMSNSDLAIGGAGITAWERCSLGLPSLVIVLAENQKLGAIALRAIKAAILISDIQAIGESLRFLMGGKSGLSELSAMSKASASVVDGCGASRVAQSIMNCYV